MSIAAGIRSRVTETLADSIYDNPVVAKELRTRMRGKKAFAVMGGYVLILSAVMLIALAIILPGVGYWHESQAVGGTIFKVLLWTQVIMLSLIVPSVTSGALSMEIEKRTIEMLALTRLSPGRIVMGKHLSGVLYTLVLLICSLPLAGLTLMFGGISPAEILIGYLVMISWVIFTCAIGVYWSSLFDRTPVAALMAYGTCGLYLFFSTGYGVAIAQELQYNSSRTNPMALAGLSPLLSSEFSMLHGSVCGLHIPVMAVGALLHLGIAAALLLAAMMHVRYHSSDRSLPIRILLLLITSSVMWLAVGDSYFYTPGGMSPKVFPGVLFGVVLSLYILLGAAMGVFAGGPVRKGGGLPFGYGLSVRKMFRGDLRGAALFMTVWAVVLYGVFGASVGWVHAANPFKLSAAFWPLYAKMGITFVTVVAAMASLGVLFSCIFKERRAAAGVTFLSVILILAGYLAVYANYAKGLSNPNNPVWQLGAFWPITAFSSIDKHWVNNLPPFWWPKTLSWLVVSIAYLGIMAVALWLCPRMHAKHGGVQED